MSELNDVAGGETIASTFTNQVKERTVMRYASAAARDASIPAPIAGSLAFLDDTDTITMYDGGLAAWVTVATREYTEALYLHLTGVAAQQADTDLDVNGELQVIQGGQSLLSPLVRDVVIDGPALPPFSVRGALLIDPVGGLLYYSDGTQWVLAITGV